MDKDTEWVSSFTQMEGTTLESGNREEWMDKEPFTILRET